jgi:hypothetical protein
MNLSPESTFIRKVTLVFRNDQPLYFFKFDSFKFNVGDIVV